MKKVALSTKLYSMGGSDQKQTSPGLRGGSVFKTSAIANKMQRNSPSNFGLEHLGNDYMMEEDVGAIQ